jgi:DNA-binding NarL/FixJ family response regulator
MTEARKIRILIADDFKSLREVIRLYLERAADMDVVGEAPELDQALETALALQPDVIVMNDYLPPINSAHAAEVFRASGVSAAILAISLSLDPQLIRHSLHHGINGFMEKDEIDSFLVEAIRSLHRGERYLSPHVREIFNNIPE